MGHVDKQVSDPSLLCVTIQYNVRHIIALNNTSLYLPTFTCCTNIMHTPLYDILIYYISIKLNH